MEYYNSPLKLMVLLEIKIKNKRERVLNYSLFNILLLLRNSNYCTGTNDKII